ncbi:MAG: hypothetical protein BGO24_18920 [Sphingomonas sp. 67-36]|nr:MAG: hypothetical protein BGO24_18920 [Sphingomonas sp. 67-36]
MDDPDFREQCRTLSRSGSVAITTLSLASLILPEEVEPFSRVAVGPMNDLATLTGTAESRLVAVRV